jgi:hypothetical protein
MGGWTDIYTTDPRKRVRQIGLYYITCYKVPLLAVQFLLKHNPLIEK